MRSSLVRLAMAALIAGSAGACLQPVHGTRLSNGQSAAEAQLAQVSVAQIDGAFGYQLQSELNFLLNGSGAPVKNGRYLLKVRTQQGVATSIIDASTGRAQIATAQVEAVYVLIDQKQAGKIRASGNAFASASFDRSQMRYATLRAQKDAEEKVAKALAERLRILVLTALSQPESSAGAPPELSKPIDPDSTPKDPGDET